MDEETRLDIAEKIDKFIELQASSLNVLRDVSALLRKEQGVVLDVPWLSQLGPDAAFAPGDCGPACLAMWLRYLGHSDVTVDDVSKVSRLDQGFKYTMPAHLIWAAREWNVDLYWRKELDIEDIWEELDAGQPCIVLAEYDWLPYVYDSSYTKSHWLLMTGYEYSELFYNDPYWPDSEGGRCVEINKHEFMGAWQNVTESGNSARQALRIYADELIIKPIVRKRLDRY